MIIFPFDTLETKCKGIAWAEGAGGQHLSTPACHGAVIVPCLPAKRSAPNQKTHEVKQCHQTATKTLKMPSLRGKSNGQRARGLHSKSTKTGMAQQT